MSFIYDILADFFIKAGEISIFLALASTLIGIIVRAVSGKERLI